jgi:hypothetical protein
LVIVKVSGIKSETNRHGALAATSLLLLDDTLHDLRLLNQESTYDADTSR